MPGRQEELQEDVRFRILRLLEDNPELSQRELADALNVSLGGVNYCLKALLDKGLVKLGNFSASRDKRRYAYVLTRKGIAEKAALTGRFLKRKMAEYEALKTEIEALQAEMAGRDETPMPRVKRS
ncbi:MAG: MarR family EPS-associated transcriptional regulator [Minwuia sp.]|uniref:MarR family EPS-associated transcriptional regulator n=1 Tax=Minwuia sp. TaxID=2493630 RepID=UPI003A861E95